MRDHGTVLPADGHVHTEWSWDAPAGSMERTCARAVEIGLPSVAFTEHADLTPWTLDETPGGVLVPPDLDIDRYLACLQRCRDRYPQLRILSGVELSEPHWHERRTAQTLELGGFDRVLGSVHALRAGADTFHPVSADTYRHRPAADVVRAYLAEVARMVAESDAFAVLAHIDYPLRYWPADAGPYEPHTFEEEYRDALGALAGSGRALEVNTRVPLHPSVVGWWYDAGGQAVTFGSDAHDPDTLARDFPTAAAMVEAHGFRPGRYPHDPWVR